MWDHDTIRRMARGKAPDTQVVIEQAATIEEIEAAIEALTEKETARLRSFARRRVDTLGPATWGRDEKVLLQEALTSVVSGNRHWIKGRATFAHFLIWAMQSISNNWCKKFYAKSGPHAEISEQELNDDLTTSSALTPEVTAILKERVAQIRSLVLERPLAKEIVDGLLDGMTVSEIREIIGPDFAVEMKWIRDAVRRREG